MTIEVMKQALEALERYQVKRQDFDRFADEITALRQAISQPPGQYWTDCIFTGDPPDGFKTWIEFAGSNVRHGIRVSRIDHNPQPDCRGCNTFMPGDDLYKDGCNAASVCTNGDKFQVLPKVVLYKVT
jgi:hypothetical protein